MELSQESVFHLIMLARDACLDGEFNEGQRLAVCELYAFCDERTKRMIASVMDFDHLFGKTLV